MKNKRTLSAILFSSFLCFLTLFLLSSSRFSTVSAADDNYSFIILSTYEEHVNIGDEFYLFAFTSTGKKATFKSSDSKIASVNTYGMITAKKNGTVKITAKIKNAEASCTVTVAKTSVSLNQKSASLESGSTLLLTAKTSTGTPVRFKSNKSSVATIDESGLVTANKPGEATITVTADTTSVTCQITVKSPKLKLSKTTSTLYRNGTLSLMCSVSSGKTPAWKTNRKSVATVDANGTVTAIKHGTAIITATVDGVSKTCEIIVKQPVVSLSDADVILTQGDTVTLTATVSSGNMPIWSSSNTSIVTVTNGTITAITKGTAYIYAAEDGIKARCKVKVVEPAIIDDTE